MLHQMIVFVTMDGMVVLAMCQSASVFLEIILQYVPTLMVLA